MDEAGQQGQGISLVTSTNRSKLDNNFMDAARRKGRSFEERITRFHNQSDRAHAIGSSMSAADIRRSTIADRTRFQELRDEIWLWIPMLLLAVAVSWYRQDNKAESYGSTSALSGLRLFLVLWIMLEHAGFKIVTAAGSWIVLSGVALSTSRVASPGLTKTDFNTLQNYSKFLFLRMARIFPLYWFYLGCLADPHSLACEQNKFVSDGMALFYLNMPRDFINAIQDRPLELLLLSKEITHTCLWFLQTIFCMYIMYPVLEAIALGSWRTQPQLASDFRWRFFMCCLAKLVAVSVSMFLLLGPPGWHHMDVYTNPVLRIPDFMMGLLVPHLAHPDGKGWIQWAPLVADILLVSLGFVLVFAPLNPVALGFLAGNLYCPVTAFAMWGFCFGPTPSPLGRFLSKPLFVKTSEWSYGLYLIHRATLTKYRLHRNVTNTWGFPGWTAEDWFMPFCLLLLIAKSWSLFVLIESPSSDLARWAIAKKT